MKLLSKRYLIVGLDPGGTTGLAILDLNGNPLLVKSLKKPGINEIVKEINKYCKKIGDPLILAVDKKDPSKTVLKISTILNIQIYSPKEDLTREEKREFISKSKLADKMNIHEKDAYAAALKAYRFYKNLFKRIEAHSIEKMGKPADDEAKALVVKGESIASGIKKPSKIKTSNIKMKKRTKDLKNKSINLLMKIERLKKEIEIQKRNEEELKRRILELEKEKKRIETELKKRKASDNMKLRINRAIYAKKNENEKLKMLLRKLENENEKLRNKLTYINEILGKLISNKVFIPYLKTLNSDSVEELSDWGCMGMGGLLFVSRVLSVNKKVIWFLKNKKFSAIIIGRANPLRIVFQLKDKLKEEIEVIREEDMNLVPITVNHRIVGYIKRDLSSDIGKWLKTYINQYRKQRIINLSEL